MLSGLILLSGLGYLIALASDTRALRYLLKPGTMVLVVLLAATRLGSDGTYG